MASNTIRNANASVSITIRPRPENIPLPFELRETVTPEKWDSRIMQVNKLCAQYSKPLFERIWFVFALLVCIIVPAVLHSVIFNAITPKSLRDAFNRDRGNSSEPASNRFDGNSEDRIIGYIIETRWITFSIFIGLFIVLWTPFIFWKRLGTMRARALTTRWAVEDGQTGASFIPRWTIQTPGVFTINGTVTITTPPSAMPSLFNPQAYLPPYILQAGQQASGMLWAQQQPMQVPYNPYGPQTGVPVQGGPPGAIPVYFPGAGDVGPRNERRDDPFADEKCAQEYEDVKV